MVDGLFIRSLLCSFFIKIFPEIIEDGRLYIAEPPLYRVDDKKNPFVINKEDYIGRYVKSVSKDYKMGCQNFSGIGPSDDIEYLSTSNWKDFLTVTSSYVDDMTILSKHYKANDRLIEIVLEEFANMQFSNKDNIKEMIESIDIQNMMTRIGAEFNEIYYDDKDKLIKGIIDGKYQLLEASEQLIRKAIPLISIIEIWGAPVNKSLILTNIKTGTNQELSLLEILKILKKYQPNILHRFKGLGENDPSDIKITIMDPNTRSLIKVMIGDIENDMKIFSILRGTSPQDALNRRNMMKNYQIPHELLDT